MRNDSKGCVRVKRIQPGERCRDERNGGKGCARHSLAVLSDLPGCAPELFTSFFRAAALGRFLLVNTARQGQRELPELPSQYLRKSDGLSVLGGTSVLALVFPIARAPIVLARLDRVVAAFRLPARSPVAEYDGFVPQCISTGPLNSLLRPRV